MVVIFVAAAYFRNLRRLEENRKNGLLLRQYEQQNSIQPVNGPPRRLQTGHFETYTTTTRPPPKAKRQPDFVDINCQIANDTCEFASDTCGAALSWITATLERLGMPKRQDIVDVVDNDSNDIDNFDADHDYCTNFIYNNFIKSHMNGIDKNSNHDGISTTDSDTTSETGSNSVSSTSNSDDDRPTNIVYNSSEFGFRDENGDPLSYAEKGKRLFYKGYLKQSIAHFLTAFEELEVNLTKSHDDGVPFTRELHNLTCEYAADAAFHMAAACLATRTDETCIEYCDRAIQFQKVHVELVEWYRSEASALLAAHITERMAQIEAGTAKDNKTMMKAKGKQLSRKYHITVVNYKRAHERLTSMYDLHAKCQRHWLSVRRGEIEPILHLNEENIVVPLEDESTLEMRRSKLRQTEKALSLQRRGHGQDDCAHRCYRAITKYHCEQLH